MRNIPATPVIVLFILSVAITDVIAPADLDAQTVRSWLLDAGSETPIIGGRISLLDEVGDVMVSAESVSLGEFTLEAPQGGEVRLHVSRLGCTSGTTESFLLQRRVLEVDCFNPSPYVLPQHPS